MQALMRPQSTFDDDECCLDILESGSIHYGNAIALLHTAAYDQLRDVCQAYLQGMLSSDDFERLMLEIETYLYHEIVRFQNFDGTGTELFQVGLARVKTGLATLSEACLVAHYCEHKEGLYRALDIASKADREIVQGRSMLDRAAALS